MGINLNSAKSIYEGIIEKRFRERRSYALDVSEVTEIVYKIVDELECDGESTFLNCCINVWNKSCAPNIRKMPIDIKSLKSIKVSERECFYQQRYMGFGSMDAYVWIAMVTKCIENGGRGISEEYNSRKEKMNKGMGALDSNGKIQVAIKIIDDYIGDALLKKSASVSKDTLSVSGENEESKIISKAREEAEKIIAQAKMDALSIIENAKIEQEKIATKSIYEIDNYVKEITELSNARKVIMSENVLSERDNIRQDVNGARAALQEINMSVSQAAQELNAILNKVTVASTEDAISQNMELYRFICDAYNSYLSNESDIQVKKFLKYLGMFKDMIEENLALYGLSPIKTQAGEKFDAKIHKAISQTNDYDPQNVTVKKSIYAGFMWGDTVKIKEAVEI